MLMLILFFFLITGTTSSVSYDAYLTTTFHENMNPDVNTWIEGYHADLDTMISDLSDVNIILPFVMDVSVYGDFVFRNTAEEYHLKRNLSLWLHSFSTPFKMILRSSGDCSMLALYEGEPAQPIRPSDLSGLYLTFSQPQVIELFDSYDRSPFDPLYLFVPDECFLNVSVLEVHINPSTAPFTRTQLEYSHLNNRPPELIGLASNEIQNVKVGVQYIESFLFAFPGLIMSSYTESTATFTFTPSEEMDTYVVPQASTVLLFENKFQEQVWDQDTVKIRFQRQNDDKCIVPMANKRGVVFRELENGREFEIEFEKHVLQTYLPALRLNVMPDCELKVLQVSRTINFESNVGYRRLFKYGLPARGAYLRLECDTGIPVIARSNFIEDLSDFPPLDLTHRQIISSVFRLICSERYILPREVPLVLHTTVSNPRFKRDVVRMTFQAAIENCNLEIVDRNLSYLKGLTIALNRRFNRFKVTYESHRLNANFPQDTEFILKSSCDLTLIKVSRKINPKVQRDVVQIHLGSEVLY